ncbi:hypothetical protein BaRGS_00011962 [Batillaria attramentaria]|uniref:Urease accessory protein UreD n=1 Tax=Batillaria attramentaria TaxID=370345 RepID=A0ABD0LBW1_9CAEN
MTFGGGLVGGDIIDLEIHLGNHCAALLTSQESTKVYRCQNGAESQQNVTYTLSGSSFLAILPDPVVCFADARFRQTQRVYMPHSGSLVLLDWLTAGRMALDELCEVHKTRELVFRDNQQLADSPHQTVQNAMRNFQVLGQRLATDVICSYSPLETVVKGKTLTGCYLRFVAVSTVLFFVQGFSVVREITNTLTDVLGGNPYRNKY